MNGVGIGLEQDITVRSDRTLNATTADVAQFLMGSTAATGTFTRQQLRVGHAGEHERPLNPLHLLQVSFWLMMTMMMTMG